MEKEREGRSGSLVLFPGALGDAVCLEPSIAWLRGLGPVHLRARGAAAEVAALFPAQPEVGSLDAPEVARLFAPLGPGAARPPTWLTGFARVVSFTGSRSPELRARLARCDGARLVPFPAGTGRAHVIDEMLAGVSGGSAPLGGLPSLRSLHAGTPAGWRLVLHPGSGGTAKRAPVEWFGDLADRFRRSGGEEVVVLLGPAEGAQEGRWARGVGRVESPASVSCLADEIAAATVYVGNDAGPSHVAAALGVPTVVLFTVTDPARFGPRGSHVRHRHVGADDSAGSARVWEAVERLLP